MMERIKNLPKYIIALLACGLILIIYGIISRAIAINFFWESRMVGWMLLSFGVIGGAAHLLEKDTRKAKKNNRLVKIVINGVFVFCAIAVGVWGFLIPKSEAYQASKDFILEDQSIFTEVGNIEGIGFFSPGSISVRTDANGKSGEANFDMIVKGEKAYKCVSIFVVKKADTDWLVQQID